MRRGDEIHLMKKLYLLHLRLLSILVTLIFCAPVARADSAEVGQGSALAEILGAKVSAESLAPLTKAAEEKGIPEAMSFCSVHRF